MPVLATSAGRFHGLAIPEALEGSDVTSNELYHKAYRAHYKEHDAEKALALYERIISDFPDTADARNAQTQIANIQQNRGAIGQKHKRPPKVTLTTAQGLDGHLVEKNIEIVSAARVLGIGPIGDSLMHLTDIFGGKSGTGEDGFNAGVEFCLNQLKAKAAELEANAVIAIIVNVIEICANTGCRKTGFSSRSRRNYATFLVD